MKAPTGRGGAMRLPTAELEVLACLTRHGHATARQMREAMESFRPMAHGSIVTLLGRLEAKGLVTKEKGPVGKAFVYSPTTRRGHTFRGVVRDVVQRVFGGDGVALVASLFETKPPTPAEIEKLQALLDELKSRRR
ncbi:MAG: BlaI/MecI/CopY family transcriptional regulator [Planctomycetes bacterium]|nr:BlaI/MecI/CopY family transcriptional regulator [Planctomycetota bacterium]MBI3843983.1 BlaI/MecI/CopY family transcriptional regulator [Planctomycetota bacterium]